MAGGRYNVESGKEIEGSWHWYKRDLPLDFNMLHFSDLEEDTRALYHMKGDWIYADEVAPLIGSCDGSGSDREQAADAFWKEYNPKIAARLTPFVENVMVHESDARLSYKDSLFNALGHMAVG